MAVPDNETFSMQDVANELNVALNWDMIIANVNVSGFNATYNQDSYAPANSLLRFRGYISSQSMYMVQEPSSQFYLMSLWMDTSSTVTVNYDDGYIYTGTTSASSGFEVIDPHPYAVSKIHNVKLSASGITSFNSDGNNYSGITSMNVSELTELTSLSLSKNSLSAMNLSKNTKLTSFDAAYNEFVSMDFSNNPLMTYINVNYSTALTSLNITGCTEVSKLRLWNCNLSSLNLSQLAKLTYLEIAGNNITTLDITNNPLLNHLNARSNGFTEATMNSIMTTLDDNGLSNGGVWFLSGNAALTGAGLTSKANLIAKGWTVM
ncbi:hypothetical protein L3073_17620 [Ancylomarina sp. DW003]|nr:hypothetical protein [Ancylomarina sp. DW003]MDE5424038.1 hypothetical protein [Ancylomarina sp. DW003]